MPSRSSSVTSHEGGAAGVEGDAKPDSTFKAQFESLIVEEWRDHYFPYTDTVQLLKELYGGQDAISSARVDEKTPLLVAAHARSSNMMPHADTLSLATDDSVLDRFRQQGFLATQGVAARGGIVTLSDVQALEGRLQVIEWIQEGVAETNDFFETMLNRLRADYHALLTQLETVAISGEMRASSSMTLPTTKPSGSSRSGSPVVSPALQSRTRIHTHADGSNKGDTHNDDTGSVAGDAKYSSFARRTSTATSRGFMRQKGSIRQKQKTTRRHISTHHRSLARVFVQLYRNQVMLLNFVSLNYQAVDDVLKRLDACTKWEGQPACRPGVLRAYLDQQSFVTHEPVLNQLLDSTVQTFATHFENDNVENAKSRLLQKLTSSEYSSPEYLRLGVKIGLCLGLLLVAIAGVLELRSLNADGMDLKTKQKTLGLGFYASGYLPVYRGVGFLVVLCWLWGLNVYVWSKFRINYVFIFRFDPRNRLGYQRIWEESTELTIVYLINFLLFLGHVGLDLEEQLPSVYKVISRRVYPLSLVAYILAKLVLPWDSTRASLWSALKNIVTAPFGDAYFVHAYVADILTSMVKPFVDLSYVMCFYLSGVWVRDVVPTHVNQCTEGRWLMVPIVSALPFWFRFNQCLHKYFHTGERWPHLGNAAKYACAHTVIVMGSFHPLFGESWEYDGWDWTRVLWFVSVGVTTLYTFVWDVVMDWGLVTYSGGEWVVRDNLLYHKRRWYITAIVLNFFLRWSWTITLTPFDWDTQYETLLIPLLGVGELLRRTLWGCFRVEWEHLQTAKDRAVERVPVFFDNRREMKNRRESAKEKGWQVAVEVALMITTVIGLAFFSAML